MLRHQIDFLVQSGGTRVRTQVADDDFYIQTSDGSDRKTRVAVV
jgi:hypothetical protein